MHILPRQFVFYFLLSNVRCGGYASNTSLSKYLFKETAH
jgi:hypothetical protein